MSEQSREATWQVLDRLTVRRKLLLSNGYTPTPCNGKAAFLHGWQKMLPTENDIESWTRQFPRALNTGILTRTTPAIDIDVYEEKVANELQHLLMSMIGDAGQPLVCFGRRPKRAVLFQTAKSFRKIATPIFTSPDQQVHRVEVLCEGQQIIAYGMHPD